MSKLVGNYVGIYQKIVNYFSCGDIAFLASNHFMKSFASCILQLQATCNCVIQAYMIYWFTLIVDLPLVRKHVLLTDTVPKPENSWILMKCH